MGPPSEILLEEQRFLYLNGSLLGFTILILGMSILLFYYLRARVFLTLALMTLLIFPIRFRGLGIVKIYFADGVDLFFLNQGALVCMYLARVAYVLFVADLVGINLRRGWHRYIIWTYAGLSLY